MVSDGGVPSVVCLGFFDGVHIGHRQLIRIARQIADAEGLSLCVHTLDGEVFGKGKLLTTLEERTRLLLACGADRVEASTFDDALRHMPGDRFFEEIIVGKLGARHVVCGPDYRFGYQGKWGVSELADMCRKDGIGCTVVPPVTLPDGRKISSTLIRRALEEGDRDTAARLLGREV